MEHFILKGYHINGFQRMVITSGPPAQSRPVRPEDCTALIRIRKSEDWRTAYGPATF